MYKALSNITEVDLSKHALIEASAGTGKTYTIESLVLRLLMENENIELENILVVTFTEKATSELKYRIRKKILHMVDYNKDLLVGTRNKLNSTLDIFDESQILTVHGFCNTILKDFSFSLGLSFDQKLVDDVQILRDLISKQISNVWQNTYGEKLSTLLSLSNFNANKPEFVSNILNLALSCFNSSKNRMIYLSHKNMDINQLWTVILSDLVAFKNLIGTDHKFSKQFAKLNINNRSKKALLSNVIIPMEKIFYNFDSDKADILILLPIMKLLRKKTKSNEISYKILTPEKWLKSGNNIEVCPNLKLVDKKLVELHKSFLRISNLLTIATAKNIIENAKLLKLKNGWISYGDMLELTESFLYKKTSSHNNLNKLRNKYKFAFVDEFQDTDYLQWRIFKKIFLESKKGNKLFLIGDPKQAIYSFRGADIFTYFKARKEMEKLVKKKEANLYYLEKNWRTFPKLQQTLNYIFSSKYWFKQTTSPTSYEIQYNHVNSPAIDNFNKRLSYEPNNDFSNHSLNIIDLSEASSVKTSKFILAEFICKKIESIVNNPKIYFSRKDRKIKLITYNDICILVRRSSDFNFIEPILIKMGIPYTYSNKKGLFQSIEAQYVSIILHAILEPERLDLFKLVLITPFFGVPVHKFNQKEDISWDNPVIRLFRLWGDYAKEKKWGILFKSIMEDSWFVSRYSRYPSSDKTEANILKIFDTLEVIARKKNSLFELVQVLNKYMILPIDQLGEQNFQQTSREESQVQVMTIHSSKGLEFPIVFVAGGLTNYDDGKSLKIYRDIISKEPFPSSLKLIKDLTSGKNEEKCLFYVAMTRACCKLYIPYYPFDKKFSWVGPICNFISNSLDDAIKNPLNQNKLDVKWYSAKYEIQKLKRVAIKYRSNLFRMLEKNNYINKKKFRTRMITLESFSSILKRFEKTKYGKKLDYNKDFISLNSETQNKVNMLPGGSKVGSMFHMIFESINFNQIVKCKNKILPSEKNGYIIKKLMRVCGVKKTWFELIVSIVVNVLTIPIKINNESILLGQIATASRKHEVEFYFPIKSEHSEGNNKKYTSKNIVIKEKLIHGFIDMLFNFKGKVYIVDWKSNKLDNSYDKMSLKESMSKLGYDIQYKIYTVAVIKWLKQLMGNNFSLDQHFGGVLYIYLRGIAPGTQNGIYYLNFDEIKNVKESKHDIPTLIEIHKSLSMV